VLCCVIGSSKANGLVLLRMLDCLECCLICSSCKLETLNYVYLDQKLIFLCISEELGLLMDWVIYFVYHYVDLLDHWKMSSFSSPFSLNLCSQDSKLLGGDSHSRFPISPTFAGGLRQASKSLQASTRCISPNPTFTLGTTNILDTNMAIYTHICVICTHKVPVLCMK